MPIIIITLHSVKLSWNELSWELINYNFNTNKWGLSCANLRAISSCLIWNKVFLTANWKNLSVFSKRKVKFDHFDHFDFDHFDFPNFIKMNFV